MTDKSGNVAVVGSVDVIVYLPANTPTDLKSLNAAFNTAAKWGPVSVVSDTVHASVYETDLEKLEAGPQPPFASVYFAIYNHYLLLYDADVANKGKAGYVNQCPADIFAWFAAAAAKGIKPAPTIGGQWPNITK